MDAHRTEILTQCAAMRVALDALDRAGELVSDEVEYVVAGIERWCAREVGDEAIDEAEQGLDRVALEEAGGEGAFGVFLLGLRSLLKAVRLAQWADGDRDVSIEDHTTWYAEGVLEALGEDGRAAVARLMLVRAQRQRG